jgi:hypothetical protein
VYCRPNCVRKPGDGLTDSGFGEPVGWQKIKGAWTEDTDKRPKWNQISDLKKEFIMDPTDPDLYPQVSFKVMCWPADSESSDNLVRGKMFDKKKGKNKKGKNKKGKNKKGKNKKGKNKKGKNKKGKNKKGKNKKGKGKKGKGKSKSKSS